MLDGADALLASFPFPGGAVPYSRDVNVTLPVDQLGPHYLILAADVADDVYEHEGEENNTASRPLVITEAPLRLPDLALTGLMVSGMKSDEVRTTETVTWTVENVGGYAPPPSQSSWEDRLYLSPDTILDDSDVLLGTFGRTGGLAPGTSYTRAEPVTYPNGLSGDRYLLVKTDARGQVQEELEDNNVAMQSVSLAIRPIDLVVTGIQAPATALSGQPLSLTWTVANQGTSDTEVSHWYDQVHLSPRPHPRQHGPLPGRPGP